MSRLTERQKCSSSCRYHLTKNNISPSEAEEWLVLTFQAIRLTKNAIVSSFQFQFFWYMHVLSDFFNRYCIVWRPRCNWLIYLFLLVEWSTRPQEIVDHFSAPEGSFFID
jgi:hypothetical protein